MRRIEGGYNEAYVYARTLEEAAEEQIRTMCSLPFLKNSLRFVDDACYKRREKHKAQRLQDTGNQKPRNRILQHYITPQIKTAIIAIIV